MGSLSNLYISQSYQSLAHLGTNAALVPGTMTELQDGIGQSLNISFDGTNISSSGNIYAANITGSSINTGSFVTTSSFNSYTSSTNVRLNNLESTTASLNISVSELNSWSSSAKISITNLNLATQSLQSQLTAIGLQSGSWITESETGSFATTGSNNFTGSENITGSLSLVGPFVLNDVNNGSASSLVTRSGSIVFVGAGFASSSADLAHISSSANFVNFFMKNNNNNADTIISGSGNIFINPTAPTTGFKRYMTGGNISVAGSGAGTPQISASMAWSPVIANNIFANTTSPITFRGPVSSSASQLNNNIFANGTLTLGSSSVENFEKAVKGTIFTGNILNGVVISNAYKTPFIGTATMNSTGNMIGGVLTINADSSSVTILNNTLQSSLTINNSYYNASATASAGNAFNLSGGCGIFGANNTIYVSGSNVSNILGRQFISNFIAGTLISASVNLNGNTSNIIATTILGHGLSVTGSSNLIQSATPSKDSTYGSVFIGRHNAQDGTKARTAETIFAVGTGNSTINKTGLLIDSGSNTYVEGSLNVSGSTKLTGSFFIQSGSAFSQNTASALVSYDTASGQFYHTTYQSALPALFDVGAFYSTITQSGSANVSGSFRFDNTVPINSINLTSGSHINVPKTAYYNLQFSIQCVQGPGSGDVAVWLKKNGNNVANTATYITIASNQKSLMSLNLWDSGSAGDYYEIAYQSDSNNTTYQYIAPTGNIPGSPSIILTVNQVR